MLFKRNGMHNTKLIRTLQLLTKGELREFEKYLIGSHPKYKIGIRFFQHIKKYYPRFEHKRLDKAYIAKNVLTANKEKRVSNVASQLLKWLEEFLLWKKINENDYEYERRKLLIEVYEERGGESIASKERAKLLEDIKKEPIKGQMQFFKLMQIYEDQYYERIYNRYTSDDNKIQNALDQLHQFCLATRLQYSCELYCRKKILKDDTIISIPKISIEESKFPAIQTYRLLLNALSSETIDDYFAAKRQFQQNLSYIDFVDQKKCFNYLINILAGFLKRNKNDKLKETLELYKIGLERKIVLENERISATTFNNIISISSALKDFNWAKKFIDNYKTYLDPIQQQDIVNLARATIQFGEGHYTEAIEILNVTNYTNLMNKLKSKALLICCYVDMGMDENVVLSNMAAFSKLLTRAKKLEDSHVRGLKNFLKIAKKILLKETESMIIQNELNLADFIYHQTWLQEKINSYQKIY